MPTLGMQAYPFARNPVAHRHFGRRWITRDVVLLRVWKQYTQSIKSMTVDTIGQDLAFNYIVFMQFEVKDGVQTF